MRVCVEGTMLAVVVVLVLSSVCSGLILDKCDLKKQLMTSLEVKKPDQDRRVTELTCHSDVTTGFNTSAINQVPEPVNDHGNRQRRHVRHNAKTTARPNATSAHPAVTPSRSVTPRPQPAPTSRPGNASPSPPHPSTMSGIGATGSGPVLEGPGPFVPNETRNNPNVSKNMMPVFPNGAPPRGGIESGSPSDAPPSDETEPDMQPFNISAFSPSLFNFTPGNPRPERSPVQKWTLYGIFQLSDHVACTSNNIPSLNLCGLSCDQLLDDDIKDDIDCVNTIYNSFKKQSNPQDQQLIRKMMSLLMCKECADVKYADYFSEC